MDSPLIQPVCRGEALKQEMLNYAKESSRFHIWWLGQSGFLLSWNQHYFLFDPYLSDSLTRKYASTDKPHVRMTALAMHPSTLGFVQVVTLAGCASKLRPTEMVACVRRENLLICYVP